MAPFHYRLNVFRPSPFHPGTCHLDPRFVGFPWHCWKHLRGLQSVQRWVLSVFSGCSPPAKPNDAPPTLSFSADGSLRWTRRCAWRAMATFHVRMNRARTSPRQLGGVPDWIESCSPIRDTCQYVSPRPGADLGYNLPVGEPSCTSTRSVGGDTCPGQTTAVHSGRIGPENRGDRSFRHLRISPPPAFEQTNGPRDPGRRHVSPDDWPGRAA